MITLQECIDARRSIRVFREEPVTRETVFHLLENAAKAPSGSNIQPWEFVVADDPNLVRSIVAFSPGIGKCPPCLIVFCEDRELALKKGGTIGRDQLALMDISMAGENLMLSAVALGLGTCAVKSFPPDIIRSLLKLPDRLSPELIITLGYPENESRVPPKRPLAELIHYNGWGNPCE